MRESADAVAVQPDRRIVVGGSSSVIGVSSDRLVVRLLGDTRAPDTKITKKPKRRVAAGKRARFRFEVRGDVNATFECKLRKSEGLRAVQLAAAHQAAAPWQAGLPGARHRPRRERRPDPGEAALSSASLTHRGTPRGTDPGVPREVASNARYAARQFAQAYSTLLPDGTMPRTSQPPLGLVSLGALVMIEFGSSSCHA